MLRLSFKSFCLEPSQESETLLSLVCKKSVVLVFVLVVVGRTKGQGKGYGRRKGGW